MDLRREGVLMLGIMLPDTVIKRDERALSTFVDDEAVLMHSDNGKYYTLDPVGSAIWRLLERPIELGSLQDKLVESFAGDAETIRSEAAAYVARLAENGLVARV